MFWQRNLGVFLQMSLDPGYGELDLGPASEGIDRPAMVNQIQGSILVHRGDENIHELTV